MTNQKFARKQASPDEEETDTEVGRIIDQAEQQ
jgi:hypothetical protein